jgi:AraC-like DNA-binding protein
MTKTIIAREQARVPRVACRMFEQGRTGHYLTCLFRPGGHVWRRDRESRVYPTLPKRETDAWRWNLGGVYGVTVILEGRTTFCPGRADARPVAAGDVIVFTGAPHADVCFDEGERFLETSLSMDRDLAERLRGIGLWPEAATPRRVDPEAARAQFAGIFHAIEVVSIPPAELLRRVLLVLGWADRPAEAEAARADESFATRACLLLRERSGPADRVEAVAEEMGYSGPHFRRLFRRAMGLGPSAYQLRERMARAMSLLRDADVKEVAAALGYSDPFVFSRQFKAQTGLPPSVFAQSLQRGR